MRLHLHDMDGGATALCGQVAGRRGLAEVLPWDRVCVQCVRVLADRYETAVADARAQAAGTPRWTRQQAQIIQLRERNNRGA